MKEIIAQKEKVLLVLAVISLGFFSRLLPHPANFTSLGAIAIFGGLYLPKRLAVILPLITMLLSDALIGFYSWPIMLSVYVSFIATSALGILARQKFNWKTTVVTTLTGSAIFYLLTNAAVWYFGTLYSKDLAGLLESYTMALPFFKNSLIGDIFYVSILVGGVEAIKRLKQRKKSTLQSDAVIF